NIRKILAHIRALWAVVILLILRIIAFRLLPETSLITYRIEILDFRPRQVIQAKGEMLYRGR
ncbi:MAG: hypothetical protein ACK5JR_18715, partial [Tropicimonas sp.]|uniref:hypothetical protein n=1 Tax=Tropicimonas sp. TaxID=2067044 RepID=UPI003A88F411